MLRAYSLFTACSILPEPLAAPHLYLSATVSFPGTLPNPLLCICSRRSRDVPPPQEKVMWGSPFLPQLSPAGEITCKATPSHLPGLHPWRSPAMGLLQPLSHTQGTHWPPASRDGILQTGRRGTGTSSCLCKPTAWLSRSSRG